MSRPSGPFAAPPPRKPPKVKRDTMTEFKEKVAVRTRDGGCVARHVLPTSYKTEPGPTGITVTVPDSPCQGPLDVDHVRASGGIGMKSPTHRSNMVVLCRWHHRLKTDYGKTWRPLLVAYLEKVEPANPSEARRRGLIVAAGAKE